MTDQSRAERLAEIAQRAEKATEGPWIAFIKSQVVAVGVPLLEQHACDKIVHWTGFDASGVPIQEQQRNAKFIAHAREDVPWLLSELEAADAENARLRSLLAEARGVLNVSVESVSHLLPIEYVHDTRDATFDALEDHVRAYQEGSND